MGREVRRVPVDWKHPIQPNPHWEYQQADRSAWARSQPTPKLHKPGEQFVPLLDGPFSEKLQEWEQGKAKWDAGEHEGQAFYLEYYGPNGWTNHEGVLESPKLYPVYAEDGETIVQQLHLTSMEQLIEVFPYEEYTGGKPDPESYVPEWNVPAEELGYCLYETVSEGTPVTPVFATPEELIDHLATEGQDWSQEPMRREAAEALVRGGWAPSAIVVSNASGTTFLKGDMDADKIEQLGKS